MFFGYHDDMYRIPLVSNNLRSLCAFFFLASLGPGLRAEPSRAQRRLVRWLEPWELVGTNKTLYKPPAPVRRGCHLVACGITCSSCPAGPTHYRVDLGCKNCVPDTLVHVTLSCLFSLSGLFVWPAGLSSSLFYITTPTLHSPNPCACVHAAWVSEGLAGALVRCPLGGIDILVHAVPSSDKRAYTTAHDVRCEVLSQTKGVPSQHGHGGTGLL